VTPAPSLGTVLSRIGETQAPLPAPAAVLIGLAVLAAVSLQEIWLLAQHVNTIAHEGAHAIIGSAVGRPSDHGAVRPAPLGYTPACDAVIRAARSSGCRNDGGGGGPQLNRPRAPSRVSGAHSWSSMMQSMSE
jgi:hypothetical protein